MGFGFALFSLLETYAWNFHQSVFTNYLREVQWRLYVTVIIALFISGIVRDFDLFIKLYSLSYLFIAVTLLITLVATGKIHFTLKPSKVTRRYLKLILKLCSFVYAANLIVIVSQVFDSIVIASLNGLDKAGIFALATLMGSVIQAPQRGIVAASVSHLSRAWKEKDRQLLQRVYQRSSINMLIFACGLFVLIALNYQQAILTLKLKPSFLLGFNAFLLIGLTRTIDMGTGVNAQIITTSTWWKFELVSGLILLSLMLPLTYILTKQYGIVGPAIASLVSVSLYNLIRIVFLWKKFQLFPFTVQSLYALLISGACAVATYLLFAGLHGFPGLFLRSAFFLVVYALAVWKMKLSPDIEPVLATITKRLKKKKN
jgi:O-antigen/teichoic acid export membrane protein